MTDIPVAAEPRLNPEDQGRVNLYALLARLFSAGPDQGLLDKLAGAADAIEGDSELAHAWRQLCAAAMETEALDATLEFDTTFVGVGKAPVTTYMSHYCAVSRKEAVLVELRDDLAALGMARRESSAEPEDNLASLLEVMRHLAAAGSDADSLQQQSRFFGRYLEATYAGFCDAAQNAGLGDYHKAAVNLLKSFLDAELAQFEMT
jgi:TorA maturation chaperone TorD